MSGGGSEMIYLGVIFTSQKPCSFYIDCILKQMLGSLFHTGLDGCHETDGLWKAPFIEFPMSFLKSYFTS